MRDVNLELWITDEGAPEFRPTEDVDVIVEVSSSLASADFEAELRRRDFDHDRESGVICRFHHAPTGVTLDAMPEDPSILGFENRWQGEAVAHAVERKLPSGRTIRLVPPPFLLATKIEAFKSRGKGDFLGSRDFGDIIALIDGRDELVSDISAAPAGVKDYLADELSSLRADPYFETGVAGALRPDPASQARGELVVQPRIDTIIEGAAG